MSLMIAGKRAAKAIGIVMSEELADWKRIWLQPGEVPYCDMDSKIIASPPFGFLDKKQDAVVRGCNIHESSHAIITEPLSKMRAYIEKKGESESLKLLQNVVNAIEDRRIELWAASEWMGAGPALNECHRIISSEQDERMKDAKHFNSVGDVRQALVYLSFKDMSIPVGWEPSKKAQEYIDLIGDKFHSWKNLDDLKLKKGFWNIVDLSREIVKLLADKMKEDEKQKKEQSEQQEQQEQQEQSENSNKQSEQGGSDETDESDETDDNSNGSDETDEFGETDETDDNSNGSDESDESDESDDSEYKRDKDCSASKCGDDEITDDEAYELLERELGGEDLSESLERITSEISQDSWDDDEDHYVADTTNDEWVVPKGNSTKFEEARNEITCSVSKMTKYMEDSLRAITKSRGLFDRDRGKLDRRKLHQVAKSLSKKVFYKTINGKKLNTCVSIVIDESCSMRGKQERGVRCLSIAFGECLTKLNIPFEIAGFSTTGNIPHDTPDFITRSNPMIIKTYKSFEENYQSVRTRLGNISNYNNHVDGEAVEMMAYRMMNRREKRKVILCLSDGEPYAGQGDSAVFERNLIRVVKKLRSQSFEIYGFGIKTHRPEVYYGKDYFVYLDSVKDMGIPFFRKLFEVIGKGL